MATIKSELDYIQEARSQLAEALITKFGVRRYDNAKDNPTLKGLWTVKADGSADKLKRLHDWALLVTGTNVHTDASLTFKSDGKGDAAGTTFNGSVARSISYNSIGAAPAVTGGYLPLSGGTMTGQIKGNNKGGSLIAGRTNAAIYLSCNTTNDWHPVIGFKTKTGSWEFGSVGSDDLATFSWGSDSNYSSGTNSTTTVSLRTKSGTIALTSEIPTKASWNYDDVYSKLGHTHTTTIATSTDTNQISLTYGGKYKLTAGGTSYIFTMPASDNTNTAHTTFAWTGGTTAGPTGLLSGNHAAVAFPAIPSASASTSGIVTTGTLTFAGNKIFAGNIIFSDDYKISWVRNTDAAEISFKNTGDADTDSYMLFHTANNGNEYFKWNHTAGGITTDWMTLKSVGLTVTGYVSASQGFIKNNSGNDYVLLGGGGHKAVSDFAVASHRHNVNQLDWPGGSNLIPTATANGQEWSIDLNPGSYTGTYFHILSTSLGASIACFYPDNRHVYIPVHLYVGSYNNTSYALSTASFISNSWVRTKGSTGWYSEDYGGGWYMSDTSWIRSYNNKGVYIDSGTFYNLGNAFFACTAANKVGIGTTSPSQKLHVSGGIMRITNNGKYVDIGAQTSNWIHFQADQQYYFYNSANNTAFNTHVRPYSNDTKDLGSSSLEWATGYVRKIYTRHLDASKNYTEDGYLYLGYQSNTTALQICKITNFLTVNNVAIDFRPAYSSGLASTISFQASGNEALVFANKHSDTSFIFVTGEDSIANHASDRWRSLVNTGIQIKRNCVGIGSGWDNNVNPDYKLKVGGTIYSSSYIYGHLGDNKKTIKVDGDANTYYPVLIANPTTKYPMFVLSITRHYSETAPDTWNTSSNKGGLTFSVVWNGSTYYDGNGSSSHWWVIRNYQNYSTQVANISNFVGYLVVWLRGGGATYHLFSPAGVHLNVVIKYESWTDRASRTAAPTTMASTINCYYPIGVDSATNTKNVIVNQHTGNDANYPLVWSNQDNFSTVTANQLYKSWNHLYYNPLTRRVVAGRLELYPVTDNYSEGIRIHPASNNWVTIMLCGTDNTGINGTSTNSWGIFNNNGNFYINRATSNGQGTSRLWGRSTGWTIGNINWSSYTLEVGDVLRVQNGIVLGGYETYGTHYLTGAYGRIFFGNNFHLDSVGRAGSCDMYLLYFQNSTIHFQANKLLLDSIGRIYPGSTSARRAGMYGIYDSTKVGHIWSMGTSYMIHDDGANFGNLYGLAYKYTDNATGGTMAGGHQAVWCDNGNPRSAMGYNGFWAAGGYYKNGSSNNYVLLGGGGHKALSDFSMAHSHPYLPLSGGWMDAEAQIYFRGAGGSTSAYTYMGYKASLSGKIMHCAGNINQTKGFYIASNGYESENNWGGIAIDGEGVTVFGAGDGPGNGSTLAFTGVFRVLNEDNVGDGPQFLVTKSSGCTCKYNMTAANFYSSSDIRLKNNINNISKSIRSFTWKESGLKSYGLIAQEIEDKYPELVSSNDNGYKSINYTSALCMLVAKLENTVDTLKERIELLELQLKMYHGNNK